jgi:hypothetical protein
VSNYRVQTRTRYSATWETRATFDTESAARDAASILETDDGEVRAQKQTGDGWQTLEGGDDGG